MKRDFASVSGPDYVLTNSQYESVDVTGSRLPVLVPTAGSVKPLPPISPITVVSAEAFRTAMMSVRGPARR